jgi:hypothetical protein
VSLSENLSGKINARKSEDFAPHEVIFRLLDWSARRPSTLIEKLTVKTLKDREPTVLPQLVERLADDLYRDEVRNGAWTLDIGLFGSRLFTRDVARELKPGDGILWEIRQERDAP